MDHATTMACDCDFVAETRVHLLFHCPLHQSVRQAVCGLSSLLHHIHHHPAEFLAVADAVLANRFPL